MVLALQHSPVTLNSSKSSENTVQALKSQGLKALGSFIGPTPLRKAFLQGKVNQLSSALDSLRDLPKQHALLLLRGSIHLLLRHLLRQLNPEGLKTLWKQADAYIGDAVERLIARNAYDATVIPQRNLIAIPVREGGLGIPNHAQLFEPLYDAAYRACTPQLIQLQPGFTPQPTLKTLNAKETLIAESDRLLQRLKNATPATKLNARLENASFLGRQWLRVLPTQKHHLLADSEITEALRTRLLIPCRNEDTLCSHCGTAPKIGHEDVCRGAARRWIARHDQITRAFIRTLASRADLQVEGEPKGPEDTGGELRADFSVLIGTSRRYYDVQIVALNKDSGKKEPYATLKEAADAKRLKYKSLGEAFEPLIFSAGGLMEEGTAQAYKALQKLLGPARSHWLSNQLAITLAQARAHSAGSIAQTTLRTA